MDRHAIKIKFKVERNTNNLNLNCPSSSSPTAGPGILFTQRIVNGNDVETALIAAERVDATEAVYYSRLVFDLSSRGDETNKLRMLELNPRFNTAFFTSNVEIGGTISSAPNFSLNADGSAAMSGKVAIGGSTTLRGNAAIIAALPEDIRETFKSALSKWEKATPYVPEDPSTLPADETLKEAIIRVTTAGNITLYEYGSIVATRRVWCFRSIIHYLLLRDK